MIFYLPYSNEFLCFIFLDFENIDSASINPNFEQDRIFIDLDFIFQLISFNFLLPIYVNFEVGAGLRVGLGVSNIYKLLSFLINLLF